ncbi:MAG: hypothetical protein LWW94_03080 [Candidatus Desulfofervidaceae bacterium]|nr:hypothetical protein [Candidatus Desulfofervidaceae bacterium]
MKSQKGIALLTVLIVMVIGLAVLGVVTFLSVKGYQTYRSSKNYQIALQKAQGGIEEAILNIETKTYSELQSFTNPSAQSGASYEVYQVFWKPLSGFGGAPAFPPSSATYTGVYGAGVFYLIHAQATQGESQADLYALYIKGY